MRKTVLHNIINSVKEIHNRDIKLTQKGLLFMLEVALEDEKQQIADAFDEGKNNKKITSSKYINETYERYIEEE